MTSAVRSMGHWIVVALSVCMVCACTLLKPTEPKMPAGLSDIFQRDHLINAVSGRFSIRVSTPGDLAIRGAQGQFEYLRFVRSNPYARSDVVLWVGPLGQTLGRIERQAIGRGETYRIVDSQGRMLNAQEQVDLMQQMTGKKLSSREIELLTQELIAVFANIVEYQRQARDYEFRVQDGRYQVRLIPDWPSQ